MLMCIPDTDLGPCDEEEGCDKLLVMTGVPHSK